MRAMNLGLNEGSLLKRTLLHVALFVGASALFITAVSFASVRVARAALGPAEPTTTTSAATMATEASVTGADASPSKSIKAQRGTARNRVAPRTNLATRGVGKGG